MPVCGLLTGAALVLVCGHRAYATLTADQLTESSWILSWVNSVTLRNVVPFLCPEQHRRRLLRQDMCAPPRWLLLFSNFSLWLWNAGAAQSVARSSPSVASPFRWPQWTTSTFWPCCYPCVRTRIEKGAESRDVFEFWEEIKVNLEER